MRKVVTILLTLGICFFLAGCSKSGTFSLEKKYYKTNEFNELSIKKYNKLIKDKESFAIFIYQPLCTNSYEFNKLLTSFVEKYQISFYKMSFSNLKETKMANDIKYYPSFVIYKDGKLVDFLDADSNDDKEYYKNIDEFEKWFSGYVKLPKANENTNNSEAEKINSEMKIDAKLKNIKYDKNKVNIYFFWGDGCPHCEEEFAFFNSIETEYGDYFVLNTFETWKNKNNKTILTQFSGAMGDEVKGVPYTIIGNKTFSGFGKSLEKEILNAIKEQHKDSYDVYFDKTKK